MKLLGSTTSPYARRIRLYLIDKCNVDNDVEFIDLDIFNSQDRALLTENNPAQKIPVLIDNGIAINDSGVIFRYLLQKLNQPALTWQQENILTLIDAANDSMVSMLLLMRSGVDIKQQSLFFDLQRERVNKVLISLNQSAENGEFKQWNYLAICLFCLLDWLSFRELYDWQTHIALSHFYQSAKMKKGVDLTDPRMN